MIETKYRAWNKVKKEMVTDAINNCVDSFDMILKYPQIYDVMQYTGLKDKNGVEIYVGDIVGAFENEIKAEIIRGFCGFEFKWITKRVISIRRNISEPMFSNTSLIFKVIGNIYENPELLDN